MEKIAGLDIAYFKHNLSNTMGTMSDYKQQKSPFILVAV